MELFVYVELYQKFSYYLKEKLQCISKNITVFKENIQYYLLFTEIIHEYT